jgi:hypothetical protein
MLDPADQNDVVSAVVLRVEVALEHGQRRLQHRAPGDAGAVGYVFPFIRPGSRKARRDVALILA